MTPRKYAMSRRATAAEETRRKILQASLALHSEKGFEATSWKDIAARADVAVGTVYHHFPTMDELVPACSALAREHAQVPGVDIFDGARTRDERIEVLVREVFAYNARIDAGFSHALRERHRFAVLDRAVTEHERLLDTLVRAALGKDASAATRNRVAAIIGFKVWDSFRDRGIPQRTIVSTVVHAIRCITAGD